MMIMMMMMMMMMMIKVEKKQTKKQKQENGLGIGESLEIGKFGACAEITQICFVPFTTLLSVLRLSPTGALRALSLPLYF